MPRAYFGAGVFLIAAVVQGYTDISDNDVYFKTLKSSFIAVLSVILFFTYMDSGANMIRIYREYHEREVYLEEKAAAGEKDVTVPMLRPGFETNTVMAINLILQMIRSIGLMTLTSSFME